jgi:hypothetical protein
VVFLLALRASSFSPGGASFPHALFNHTSLWKGGFMKSQIALLLSIAATTLVSCCNGQVQCPAVPESNVKEEQKLLAEIAANLSKLQIDAKAKTEFQHNLDVAYQKLSDDATTYVLFLRSINCFLDKNTPAANQMAADLMEILRLKVQQETRAKGFDPNRLSDAEHDYIAEWAKRSPDNKDEELFSIARKLNIKP